MRALQQAEESRDVGPLAEMFTEDAELSNLALAEPMRGSEGVSRFWQDYLSVFQTIRSEFTHVVEGEDSAALEWVSEGQLRSGEPFSYRGISVLEITAGKVRRFRAYYDSAAFLPQGAKRHASDTAR
jgi:ketosteroid isomerase-like protein